MVIAGAGGHALEVFDVLIEMGYSNDLINFYDDISDKLELCNRPIIKSQAKLKRYFSENDQEFCLGVGNPKGRKMLFDLFSELGGVHISLRSTRAFVSENCLNHGADIMTFAFVSSRSELGNGSLINTRSNIHHEVKVGEFTEISPAATILGGVNIGSMCRIGSNTTILPNVNLAKGTISGAGSVITRDVIEKYKLIKGVPAK